MYKKDHPDLYAYLYTYTCVHILMYKKLPSVYGKRPLGWWTMDSGDLRQIRIMLV